MPIIARSTLKNWFRSLAKPSAAQFAGWIDSFWHKGEDAIPITAIDTLSTTLAGKVDQSYVDAVLADEADARQDADSNVISILRDGVTGAGNTLKKLYNIIQNNFTEVTVADISARNAYVAKLGDHVFVTDDGDDTWALYKATTAGAGATYVKLSDPDSLNAAMSAAQIKTSYESNTNTNAFTNSQKTKLDALPTNSTLQTDLGDKVDKVTGKSLISDSEIARLATMTAVFTTALKTAYDDAVSKAHTHSNITTLDAITSAFTTALKTKLDGLPSSVYSQSDVDTSLGLKVDKVTGKSLISDTEIARLASMTAIFTTALKTAYDDAVSKAHTHSNITTLDAITSAFTTALKTKLDGLPSSVYSQSDVDTALGLKVDKVTGKSLISDTEIARLASMTAIFTTALKTGYDDAVSKAHTHSNSSILDVISAAFTTTLKGKLDALPSSVYSQSTIDTALGLKVDKTITITINGVSYDLNANRSWSVGGVTSGTYATMLALGSPSAGDRYYVTDFVPGIYYYDSFSSEWKHRPAMQDLLFQQNFAAMGSTLNFAYFRTQNGSILADTTGAFKFGSFLQITTGSLSTGWGSVDMVNGIVYSSSTKKAVIIIRFRLNTLSTSGEEYNVSFGLHSAVLGSGLQGVYLWYDRVNKGANLYCGATTSFTTTTNAYTTYVDTGVAADTNLHELVINFEAGSSCKYYLDGTLVGTISTNLPSTNQKLWNGCSIRKSAGTTARTVDFDYLTGYVYKK